MDFLWKSNIKELVYAEDHTNSEQLKESMIEEYDWSTDTTYWHLLLWFSE